MVQRHVKRINSSKRMPLCTHFSILLDFAGFLSSVAPKNGTACDTAQTCIVSSLSLDFDLRLACGSPVAVKPAVLTAVDTFAATIR